MKVVFKMNEELIKYLTDNDLMRRLPELRLKPIGAQIYCVAGAREKYGKRTLWSTIGIIFAIFLHIFLIRGRI